MTEPIIRPHDPSRIAPQAGAKTQTDDLYNSDGVYEAYVRRMDENLRQADLIVEGIHCAGCVRSIERGLMDAGATAAQVNFGNHRAAVTWDERKLGLGDIVKTLAKLGYDAHPYDPHTQQDLYRRNLRTSIARLGVAGFGAGNVMLYSVGLYAGYFYGMEESFRQLFQWISALLCVPVVLYSGWPFLRGAWGGLRGRRFNMDSLITLGILTAYVYSLVALIWRTGAETYFDSVVMITFFLLLGRTLESLARGRGGNITERLMGLQVKWATRLEEGAARNVPVEAIAPGDRLLVRVGEALPTDGVVEEGETSLDESALTGEFQPRAVRPGDEVMGGTVNAEAPLVMRARRVGTDTVLARICRMVAEAQHNKPPVQKLADRIASHFVGVILMLAAATFAYWQFVAGAAPQSPWIIAISVLIVACPCALGLATPVAVLAGSAAAARQGVLVKGGEVLERAAQVTDVVLDKTGTLTNGKFAVRELHGLGDMPVSKWLPYAAALEAWQDHPIARAIAAHATESSGPSGDSPISADPAHQPKGTDLQPTGVETRPGMGALGYVTGEMVVVGSAALLRETGIALPVEAAEGAQARLDTLVYVAIGGIAVGRIALGDPIRTDAQAAVLQLKSMGLELHLYSGDRSAAVEHVAQAVGIGDAQGGMLPGAKLTAIQALQQQGRVVAFIGDGVNDAPALTQADLAVAVGTGSDIALEAAHVILVRSNLLGVVAALTTARRTFRVIRQNLGLSIGYNAIAVPVAMAGLVIPLLAAIAMSASSLLVVANALRLRLGLRDLQDAAQHPAQGATQGEYGLLDETI